MPNSILQDVSFLQLLLWIASALFLLSLGRIYLVARQNRNLRKDNDRMENWAVTQQAELTSIHHDAQSWRAKTQRQFDAVRADLDARLQQVERAGRSAQQQIDAAREKALAEARARIAELEAQLEEAARTPAPAAAPVIPALPAMETLRVEALETELAAVKAEAAMHRQQKADLQRSLLLVRRKQPSPRRNGSRVARPG